jgi:hypothetical protein
VSAVCCELQILLTILDSNPYLSDGSRQVNMQQGVRKLGVCKHGGYSTAYMQGARGTGCVYLAFGTAMDCLLALGALTESATEAAAADCEWV